MAWSDRLKINKQLVRSLTEAGLTAAAEIQSKTLTRIHGGQDLITIAPEGSGRSTTCVIAALNRFKHGFDDAPRVLILSPGREQVLHLLDLFERINKNKTIRVLGLYAPLSMESQLDALADGTDIIVATPDRARAIYLKLALNLNKIELLILDDADLMVKQGLQLPVTELANSITKCQHLVFSEVVHAKLNLMIEPFMTHAVSVEIELEQAPQLTTYEQILYRVPNFRTKLNLLNLFLEDADLFTKVLVIVNTRQTLEKIYESSRNIVKNDTIFFKHSTDESVRATTTGEFLDSPRRILLALSENIQASDADQVPIIIHFDLPEKVETYVERVSCHQSGSSSDKITIALATDLELNMVRKIEQATGIKLTESELPDELKIDTGATTRLRKTESEGPSETGALHAKKAANAKTYNYSAAQKAKMNKKKKHR